MSVRVLHVAVPSPGFFRFAVQASAERIKACADVLNQWYQYKGYLLSSVSDAVISSNGTYLVAVWSFVV